MSKVLHSPISDMSDAEFTAFSARFGSNILDSDVVDEIVKHDEQVKSVSFNDGVMHGFRLCGHGVERKPDCGKFSHYVGCVNVAGHGNTLLGDFSGKVYAKPVFKSCDNPRCPTCYLLGYAVREAHRVDVRLGEASNRLQRRIEHSMISLPEKDYDLPYKEQKRRLRVGLDKRGVIGGAFVFHHARYASFAESKRYGIPQGWRYAPHAHVLGFLQNDYACRRCPKFKSASKSVCGGCAEFEGFTRRVNESDGMICKVMGERKSVFHSAFYELNHAGVKVDVPHFRVVTWFGVCSYRRLKVVPEKYQCRCPLCQTQLFKLLYFGSQKICLDRSSKDFKSEFFMDFLEDGRQVWFVDDSKFRYVSGA